MNCVLKTLATRVRLLFVHVSEWHVKVQPFLPVWHSLSIQVRMAVEIGSRERQASTQRIDPEFEMYPFSQTAWGELVSFFEDCCGWNFIRKYTQMFIYSFFHTTAVCPLFYTLFLFTCNGGKLEGKQFFSVNLLLPLALTWPVHEISENICRCWYWPP